MKLYTLHKEKYSFPFHSRSVNQILACNFVTLWYHEDFDTGKKLELFDFTHNGIITIYASNIYTL